MKIIKIFIHTQSWNINPNNTDLRLRKVLQSMQDRFPEVSIYIPKSWFAGIEFVFKYFFQRLQALIFKKVFISFNDQRSIYCPELLKFKPNIIISQGHIPKNNYGKPVIWETFFIDQPNYSNILNDKNWNTTYRNILNYGEKVSIIAVRDNYSIKLLQKTFPQFHKKIRFLPFYLPDLEYINEEEIRAKHTNYTTIKLS